MLRTRLILVFILLLVCSPVFADGQSGVMVGKISDDGLRVLRIDASTHSIQTIDYAHHEVHAGSHYLISGFTDLAAGNNIDLVISTPNTTKWLHILFEADVEAESTLTVFEDCTVLDDGINIIPCNSNRNSTKTSVAFVSQDSTVITEGLVCLKAKQGSGKGTGGGTRSANELILKQGSKYLFRISNDSVSTGWVSQQLHWYEHTDRN